MARLRITRWREDLHPRADDGEFASAPGGGATRRKPARGRKPTAAEEAMSARFDALRELNHAADDPDAPPASREWEKRQTPLTDAEYEAHVKSIATELSKAIGEGQETHLKYTRDGDGVTYTPERARMHKEIVDDLYGRAHRAGSDGKAVISGGLGGAGKSTVLDKHAGINKDDYLTINPDDVKEVMANRRMVPELPGVSPMEAIALVHEESSMIANMLAKRAYADHKNVIWDITMSKKSSVEKRINELRAAGYSDIRGVFVDIPVETSVKRALSRHRRGHERYRVGGKRGPTGQWEPEPGGRYVPPEIIRANATASGSSANRLVFDSLRSQFDGWQLFDNSGTAPVKLSASYDDDEFDPGLERERALDRTRQIREAARRQRQGQNGGRS